MVHIAQFHSPLGTLFAVAGEGGLLRLDFLDGPVDDLGLRALAVKFGFTDTISLEWDALFGELEHQIGRYFQGKRQHFDIPLDLRGTTFQREVWDALLTICMAQPFPTDNLPSK